MKHVLNVCSKVMRKFVFVVGELECLHRDALQSKRSAFADGTLKNLKWQWRIFIMFCIYFNFTILPASVECLCLYAQFLSRSLKAVDSVRNYMSGVSTLHLLCEVEYLGKNNIELRLLLRGIARNKPHLVKQAAPLSPHILVKLFPFFDFSKAYDCTMWALLLIAFFTMSRKSNLVVTGAEKFNGSKQLSRSDVLVGDNGLLVTFKWSKTNQFGKRAHVIPIVAIPGSPLCPLQAYSAMLQLCPGCPTDPAFFQVTPGRAIKKPITYAQLQKCIKDGVSRLGLDPDAFSSHSLRRAGASWAFRSRVPSELIKSHGDWASLAYLRYLDFSLDERLQVAESMSNEIIRVWQSV